SGEDATPLALGKRIDQPLDVLTAWLADGVGRAVLRRCAEVLDLCPAGAGTVPAEDRLAELPLRAGAWNAGAAGVELVSGIRVARRSKVADTSAWRDETAAAGAVGVGGTGTGVGRTDSYARRREGMACALGGPGGAGLTHVEQLEDQVAGIAVAIEVGA